MHREECYRAGGGVWRSAGEMLSERIKDVIIRGGGRPRNLLSDT